MEYEVTHAMPAGKYAVFDVAADADHMAEWLPTAFDVTAEGDGTVHVEGDSPGGHYSREGLWRAERDQLRIEWGSAEDGRYAGWMQMTGIEDDASEVVLHLSFFGDQEMAEHHDDRMEQGMSEALARLADAVEQRS